MTVKAKVFARIEADQTSGDASWTPMQAKASCVMPYVMQMATRWPMAMR